MKTLELEPLREKKLTVVLLEKEYNEPWWLIPQPHDENDKPFEKASPAFCEFLRRLVESNNLDFATEELGMRDEKEFYKTRIAELFKTHSIPLYPVDIDANAQGYLAYTVHTLKTRHDEIAEMLSNTSGESISEEQECLSAYGQYYKQEFEGEMMEIANSIRPKWIAMDIINRAKEMTDTSVTAIHICSPQQLQEMSRTLTSLDVSVTPIEITKEFTPIDEKLPLQKALDEVGELKVRITPKVVKTGAHIPDILFFLVPDEHVSPFDISMAYDVGFDTVIPYNNVDPAIAKDLVQDAIFSRSGKGIKHTCFLIGGNDIEKAKEILEVVQDTMFPPFQASVVIDPNGAYTTASAMMALVQQALPKVGLESFDGKKVVILGGTGPVGNIAAMICATHGAAAYITSRKLDRAESIAKRLSEECEITIHGAQAANPEEVHAVVEDADIILATGAPGVCILPEDVLERLSGSTRIVADVNAVSPLGIGGLEVKDDLREISPDVYGIGPLTIGDVKYKLEKDVLNEARRSSKDVFDYDVIFERTAEVLIEKPKIPESVELSMPISSAL